MGRSHDKARPRRDELPGTVAFEDPSSVDRRGFFAQVGATLAVGLAGCTRAPREELVPYVVQPPEVLPGRPRVYATTWSPTGHGMGLVVETHEGRPTKVEGNPRHPASLGGASALDQALVESLYDASRAAACKEGQRIAPWSTITNALTAGAWTKRQGEGLHLILDETSSPTVGRLLDELRRAYPKARVTFASPPGDLTAWQASRAAFGRVADLQIDLAKADVILSLDRDFLGRGPARLALARSFANERSPEGPGDKMNRLYIAEPLLSTTGASADHRLAVPSLSVLAVAARIAGTVGITQLASNLETLGGPAEEHRRWAEVVARDLTAHRGRSVVLAGEDQPGIVHVLAHALNERLGNLGETVHLVPPSLVDGGGASHDLRGLVSSPGPVETVLVASNLAYTSASARGLKELLGGAKTSVYLGVHEDETSAWCTHFATQAHPLESWGDARAFDGTLSLAQPLLSPLYEGRTLIELLAILLGRHGASAYDLVRETFVEVSFPGKTPPKDDVDRAFRASLKSGLVEGSAFERLSAHVDHDAVAREVRKAAAAMATQADLTPRSEGHLSLERRPDPALHDGRVTPSGLLLELPSPITSLTWTNAATIGTDTARALGITSGDEVELSSSEGHVLAPAFVVSGQAEGTVGLSLGWGRTAGPTKAVDHGTSAYALGGQEVSWATVKRTEKRRDLAIMQENHSLEGRDEAIARTSTLAALGPGPSPGRKPLSLYEPTLEDESHAEPRWAMAIDLSRCTGCGACVVACQAENNTPAVGEANARKGRTMHWLRVDSYEVGGTSSPDRVFQPMLCQHCEKAPCEYVCPVNATVHTDDGLNAMVYNRCVGTRFCSNNCPYKVRRFNWFDFHRDELPVEELAHNPNVTVRERGVMEKCTFCVQRIRGDELRRARGEIPEPLQTACQQTCPSGAIVFGDLRDKSSAVALRARSARAYAALEDLGTRPRVRYLTRVRNPNPELA